VGWSHSPNSLYKIYIRIYKTNAEWKNFIHEDLWKDHNRWEDNTRRVCLLLLNVTGWRGLAGAGIFGDGILKRLGCDAGCYTTEEEKRRRKLYDFQMCTCYE
jgi:hypothetical protein